MRMRFRIGAMGGKISGDGVKLLIKRFYLVIKRFYLVTLCLSLLIGGSGF